MGVFQSSSDPAMLSLLTDYFPTRL
jgi:sugar phosphate permease